MFCKFCGTKLEDNNNICPSCNKDNSEGVQPPKKDNNVLVFVIIGLVILLVAVGIVTVVLLTGKTKEDAKPAANDSTTIETKEITTSDKYDMDLDSKAIMIKDPENIEFKSEDNSKRSEKIELLGKVYHHDDDHNTNQMILVLMNNNDEMVEVFADLNFYQGGMRVSSEVGDAMHVKPHSKFVITISQRFHTDYDKVDITYFTTKTKSIYTDVPIKESDIKYRSIPSTYGSTTIYVDYPFDINENTSSHAYVIYKKNGKLVYAQSSIRDSVIHEAKFYPDLYHIDYDEIEVGVSSNTIQSNDY